MENLSVALNIKAAQKQGKEKKRMKTCIGWSFMPNGSGGWGWGVGVKTMKS